MELRTAALAGLLGAGALQTFPHPNVITGTVTTSDGRPVAGAVVTVVERGNSPNRPFHPVDVRAHVTTDEHGAYRLEDVRLGEFFVVAIPHNPIVTADRRVNRSGYRITYYPSAKTAADAMPVTVNIQKPTVADIKLVAATLSVVSGTVIGQNKEPVHEGTMVIAHGDNLYGMDSMGVRIRPDGGFLLPLPPGTYFLQYHESPWPPPRGEVPLISNEKIVVNGQDIAGVRVAPIHPVPITGRVVLAEVDRTGFLPSHVEVLAAPAGDGNPGSSYGDHVRDDLTFEIRAWPQPSLMRVDFAQPGWRVKRVTRDGADITDKPFDIREGHPITGVVIELERAGSKSQTGSAEPRRR